MCPSPKTSPKTAIHPTIAGAFPILGARGTEHFPVTLAPGRAAVTFVIEPLAPLAPPPSPWERAGLLSRPVECLPPSASTSSR